jgi:hypothetical protein
VPKLKFIISSHLRSKHGRFQPGIIDSNFKAAADWARDLAYTGNFQLAVDDTKITKAIRTYLDGGKWRVAGMHGKVETFASYEELMKMKDLERNELAEKVLYLLLFYFLFGVDDWGFDDLQTRIWLLIIPLPKIPPKIIATMPIRSKVTRPELRAWHDAVEERLEAHGLHHTSYNVDGVSIERGLGHDLHNEAISAGKIHTWTFQHPIEGRPPILLQAPVLKNGKPRVVGTDGKHLKKNARGSATSGARVLILGHYVVHYGMLATLAESPNSPLLRADIIGVDKQDDRACARLFSSSVIRQISICEELRPETGLVFYMWIVGEAVDAQQSRTLSHLERIKMLWRARFFFDSWRQYIINHPHYSLDTHFITRELYDIISIFINAMLMLVLIHRDFFPEIPLLLWLSSTEVCEHFFGCARKIQKDFTFAEWVLMIPKIVLLMAGEFKAKGSQAKASDHRSGYHHSWFDTTGVDPVNLATFPSDSDIQECINIAYQEASSILNLLGIENSTSGSIEDIAPQLTDALALMHPTAVEELDLSEPGPPTASETEPATVDELFAADDEDDAEETRSNEVNQTMVNLGIATTATVIYDTLRMYVF